jgi:MFS family permease
VNSWLSSTFAALGYRSFRILWAGTTLTFVAFFMSTVVQGVVAFKITGQNSSVGVVVFAQGIAQLLLGPVGGALADRVSKRKMIVINQAIITVTFFGLALLVATDHISVLFLAIGSFLTGMAFSFLGPSRQAFALELIDPPRRGNAMALNQVSMNASRILGPLFAGIFLALDFFGAAGAYFAMGTFYLLAIGTTAMLPDSRPIARTGVSILGDIAIGVRYVAGHSRLRTLVLTFGLAIMVGFPYVTVLPGLVENEFGRSARDVTILYGLNALGGLAASLAVASIADSPRATLVYLVMGVGFGVTLVLAALSPTFLLLCGAMLLMGIAMGVFQTLNGAVIAHLADPAYFGRVMSLTFLAFAGFGIAALPVGFLADAFGERATLAVLGGGVVLVVVFIGGLGARLVGSRAPQPGGVAGGGS